MIEQDSYAIHTEADTGALSSPENHGNMFGTTVIEVLTEFASQKRLIATVTGASMLIGLIFGLVAPVRYTSVTQLMPPKKTLSADTFLTTKAIGALSDVGGGLGLRDPNALYLGLLRSRPIADAIINKLNLVKVYDVANLTAARKKLAENTLIQSENTTLISISVTDKDKKRAADIANAYPEQLRILTNTVSATDASRRRVFFEEQVKNQKEALIAAAIAFQQVQQNKGMVQLDAQAQALIGGLARLRAEIEVKQVELQALRSYSTEHNPEVQLAERELSAMQEEATKKEQYSQSTGYSDLGMKDLSKVGIDYIRAQREMQYQQALFDQLLTQYEAAKLDEGKEAAIIQVVEPAIEAERASSPRRVLILVLFTMGGFFVSCLLARWKIVMQSDPELATAIQKLKGTLTSRPGKVS